MRNKRGFTLAELLVVVAVIAVLVGISIPIFTSQLEKSRESTDLANVRAAYAEVMTEAIEKENPKPITVNLKQKQNGWQSSLPITIGGVTYNGTSSANWSGIPMSNGTCKVSYNKDNGIYFRWSGATGDFTTVKDFLKPLYKDRNTPKMQGNQAYYSHQNFVINGEELKNIRVYYADSPKFKEALDVWKPQPASYKESPFYNVQNDKKGCNEDKGFAYYTYGTDNSINNFIYVNETGVYQTTDGGKTWYDITPDDE